MNAELEIRIDRDRCAGTANCEFWAANTFEVDDENKSTVIDVDSDPLDDVLAAARGCPTAAIQVLKNDALLE
jgi:ferredoxin